MKATEILNRCRDGEADVRRLQQRLTRLKKCGACQTMIDTDVEACRKQLERRQRELDAERLAACRIVNMLPDPACGILYRYFVAGQSQGCIAEALHIAESTYKKNKRRGLEMAEQIEESAVGALLPEWYGKE